jgi:hypothetical protein
VHIDYGGAFQGNIFPIAIDTKSKGAKMKIYKNSQLPFQQWGCTTYTTTQSTNELHKREILLFHNKNVETNNL